MTECEVSRFHFLFAAQSGILGFIKSALAFNSLVAKTFATRQKIIINPSNRLALSITLHVENGQTSKYNFEGALVR